MPDGSDATLQGFYFADALRMLCGFLLEELTGELEKMQPGFLGFDQDS